MLDISAKVDIFIPSNINEASSFSIFLKSQSLVIIPMLVLVTSGKSYNTLDISSEINLSARSLFFELPIFPNFSV